MSVLRSPIGTQGKRSPLKDDDTGRTANVRRSIGEWPPGDTMAPQPAASTNKLTRQAGPAKSTDGQATLRPRKPSTETKSPPKAPTKRPPLKSTFRSKTEEAEYMEELALYYIEDSRNLRRDLKKGLEDVTKRYCQMVRELEEDKTSQVEVEELHSEAKTVDSTFSISPSKDLIIERLELQTKLLQEHDRKMGELKESMEEQKLLLKQATATAATYASVAGTPNPAQTRKTLHSVVVTSEDTEETSEEVLNRVREVIDAKEGWIEVRKVRKAKDKKVIIGLETEEDRDKLKSRISKDGTNLRVEEIKNKDPLLVLKGVVNVHSDEVVLKALRNQNKDMFRDLPKEENRVEIKYWTKARNLHTSHIVICVAPIIWQRATRRGSVQIDLQRIWVEDQSPLVQCSRCLGYGHSRRFCKETADVCSHCGGLHMRAQCPDWLAGGEPSCRNCKKAEMAQADHNSFARVCPVRKRWEDIARSTIVVSLSICIRTHVIKGTV